MFLAYFNLLLVCFHVPPCRLSFSRLRIPSFLPNNHLFFSSSYPSYLICFLLLQSVCLLDLSLWPDDKIDQSLYLSSERFNVLVFGSLRYVSWKFSHLDNASKFGHRLTCNRWQLPGSPQNVEVEAS
jgi:hypothetical protein